MLILMLMLMLMLMVMTYIHALAAKSHIRLLYKDLHTCSMITNCFQVYTRGVYRLLQSLYCLYRTGCVYILHQSVYCLSQSFYGFYITGCVYSLHYSVDCLPQSFYCVYTASVSIAYIRMYIVCFNLLTPNIMTQ